MRASAAMGRGVLVWLAGCVVGCFPDPNPIEDTAETVETDTAVDDTAGTADTLDTSDSATVADTRDTDVVVDTAVDTGLACSSDCSALGSACIEGYCDAGTCRTRAKPPDSPCNDGDACTVGDRCGDGADAGACVHDSVVTCTPIDDCHLAGECNAFSGVCSNPARDDGALCESASGPLHDGDARGTCRAGVCVQLPEVSVGGTHVCALFAGGGIKCWGSGGGWLGYGNTKTIGDNSLRSIRGLPDVPAPPATKVFAGAGYTCAIFADGLRCWGFADSCLGYPSCSPTGETPATTPSSLPSAPLGQDDGAPVRPVAIASTWERGCVVTTSGRVRCFGFLDDGSQDGLTIGYPGVPYVNMPGSPTLAALGDLQLLAPETPGEVELVSIGDGTNNACASFRTGGLRCWGDTTYSGHSPTGEHFFGDDEFPSAAPMTFGADTRITSICAGYRFYCATTHWSGAGRDLVSCWGRNNLGQLGLEQSSDEPLPKLARVPLAENEAAVQVACDFASTCALTELGHVRCWGDNDAGTLGLGDRAVRGLSPGSMNGPSVALPEIAVQLSMGGGTACAVLRSGQVACWGANGGKLGIDTTEHFGDDAGELTPAPIAFGP